MSTRRIAAGLGFAIALGAPLSALAEGFWETTNDETGSRIVIPQFGMISKGTAATAVGPPQAGDISADRQFVFLGDDGGWQLRPMEYRFQGGRLVHVDDPVDHMHRLADTRPLTEQERASLRGSGGR